MAEFTVVTEPKAKLTLTWGEISTLRMGMDYMVTWSDDPDIEQRGRDLRTFLDEVQVAMGEYV
ncbi:hypothetical protein [Spirillospora sp. NPDC047279]|uniref:hypothetical protein n=1 Tax=Spirillospora sp. NPDC047279 TaxID=3155478 RepID=UPI0033C99EC7